MNHAYMCASRWTLCHTSTGARTKLIHTQCCASDGRNCPGLVRVRQDAPKGAPCRAVVLTFGPFAHLQLATIVVLSSQHHGAVSCLPRRRARLRSCSGAAFAGPQPERARGGPPSISQTYEHAHSYNAMAQNGPHKLLCTGCHAVAARLIETCRIPPLTGARTLCNRCSPAPCRTDWVVQGLVPLAASPQAVATQCPTPPPRSGCARRAASFRGRRAVAVACTLRSVRDVLRIATHRLRLQGAASDAILVDTMLLTFARACPRLHPGTNLGTSFNAASKLARGAKNGAGVAGCACRDMDVLTEAHPAVSLAAGLRAALPAAAATGGGVLAAAALRGSQIPPVRLDAASNVASRSDTSWLPGVAMTPAAGGAVWKGRGVGSEPLCDRHPLLRSHKGTRSGGALPGATSALSCLTSAACTQACRFHQDVPVVPPHHIST